MKKLLFAIVFLLSLLLIAGTESSAAELYFPHIASDGNWETEIGVINKGNTALQGTLYAYNDAGTLVETKSISLMASGRIELVIVNDFQNPSQITNMKLDAGDTPCSGYEKFYQAGQRVAIPAVSNINTRDLYVSHIASDSTWWTGLALLNTTTTTKELTISFSDGSQDSLTLAAGQHWAGTIQGSFPNINAQAVESAVISNASGVIGLELFGSQEGTGYNYLSGILLSNDTASTLYYPHVASDSQWWTGIVAYNPNDTPVTLTITPYDDQGTQLETKTVDILAKRKYVGTAAGLNLPAGTVWFKVEGSAPIAGFELFGTNNGNQLAGYSSINVNTTSGTFVKLEQEGWTGIAFVNTTSIPAAVTLSAHNNSGKTIGTATFNLPANGKQVAVADTLFGGDVSDATFIRYNSNADVVGFQLNGSVDGLMLDALPGLASFSFSTGVNRRPYAASLSRQLDLTIPYLQQQLIGNDPDYDTLLYELVSPTAGTGYSLAYINPTTGMLYLTYENASIESFSLLYRVTDGLLYSETAEVIITVPTESTTDKGTGNIEVDPAIYALFPQSDYNINLDGAVGETPSPPSSIDLSSNFPQPGDQGPQGSCVGWATAYALKSYQERVEMGWALNTQSHLFSPSYIYNQINGGYDRGSSISSALDLAVQQGIATLATMPYRSADFLSQPSGLARAEASLYKAAGWVTVSSTSQLKAALANKQPVVIAIKAYESISSLNGSDSVYNTIAGTDLGGHAVTVVGYDDNKYGGAFKVINSWGINWGDEGYFWIPYDFIPEVMIQAYILVDAGNGDLVDEDQTEPTPDANSLPNLSVRKWYINYDPKPRGIGTLTYEVINSGSGIAKAGADINLMLSKDSHIGSSDYYIIYEPIVFDLSPGEYVYRDDNNSIQFQFPDRIEPGAYYMALWVDDLNVVQESNENDNISIGSHTVVIEDSLPDISIPTWSTEWDANGNGELFYEVINNGATPTTNTDWWINLILDPDQTIDNGNERYLFFEKANYELSPGEYIHRDSDSPAYFNLYQDYYGHTIPSGIYNMALWVDDLDQVEESNEINNVSYSWGTVSIGYLGSQSASVSTSNATKLATGGTAYNGKKLPPNNLLMRKVEIERTKSGGIAMRLLDPDEIPPQKTETRAVPAKTMSSKSNLIFPSRGKFAMPGGEVDQ